MFDHVDACMDGGAMGEAPPYEDVGLEMAMKQLMEATHDALLNMKGEILRMQHDLDRTLMEVNSIRQHEECLQQQFKGHVVELEKDFCKRMDQLKETMIHEFAMCKRQSEQSMLERFEALLQEMREIQQSDAKDVRSSTEIGHVRSSTEVGHVRSSPEIEYMRRSSTDVGHLRSSTDVGHMRSSTDVGHMRSSTEIGHVRSSTDIGHVRSSTDIGHVRSSTDIGHVRSSTDIGHVRSSTDIGHVRSSTDIGHVRSSRDSKIQSDSTRPSSSTGTIKSEREKHRHVFDERTTLTEEMLQKISPKRFEHSVAVVRGWLQSPTPSESSTFVAGQKPTATVKRKLSNVPMNNLICSVKEEAKLFTSHRRAACDLTSLPHVEFVAAPDGSLSLDSFSDVHENTDAIARKPNSEEASELPSPTPECTQQNFQDMPEDYGSPKMDDSGFYNENDAPLRTEHPKTNTLGRIKSSDKPKIAFGSAQTERKQSSLASLRPNPEKRPILRILKADNIKLSDFVSDSEEESSV